MSAPLWNIILEEGSDLDIQVKYKIAGVTQNVAGYGASFIVTNSVDHSVALLTATVANSRIIVSGTTGQFDVNVPAASVNALLTTLGRDAGYTFLIWPTAASSAVAPKRLLQGCVEYSKQYAP